MLDFNKWIRLDKPNRSYSLQYYMSCWSNPGEKPEWIGYLSKHTMRGSMSVMLDQEEVRHVLKNYPFVFRTRGGGILFFEIPEGAGKEAAGS